MPRKVTPKSVNSTTSLYTIPQGGTGKTTQPEALLALGGLPTSSINAINGVLGLDANSKVLSANIKLANYSSSPAIFGPATLSKAAGDTTYYISNFDSFATYAISNVTNGTAVFNPPVLYSAGSITYTPATIGPGGFTISCTIGTVTSTRIIPITVIA